MKLDEIKRTLFATLPTPIDDAPRLGDYLGLDNLWIKRDDQTGLAMGGNKARKLEYLMADAVSKGCDVILTDGGPQSNHARMTAAAARKLGLDVKLVLGGPDFDEYQGNLLLDVVFGAEIIYLKDQDVPEMEEEMKVVAAQLESEGKKPYIIPVGGSSPVGILGYVNAMREIKEQIGDLPVQLVFAVGSCGTFAGTLLGAKLFLPKADVFGISVSRKEKPLKAHSAKLANQASELIDAGITIDPSEINAFDEYIGRAYGVPTESGKDAILTTARMEGILLDPVYTGKAMAGLFDLTRKGVLDKKRPVMFIHTGGTPALFAFEDEFSDLAVCSKK